MSQDEILIRQSAGEMVLEQETFTCEYCNPCSENEYIERVELDEHQREEHPYEYHGKHCSSDTVSTVEGGLKECSNCGCEWSED